MKRKSEAADTVDLLFHRDGVPTKMIMDGSKEQTLGAFCKKFLEASVVNSLSASWMRKGRIGK